MESLYDDAVSIYPHDNAHAEDCDACFSLKPKRGALFLFAWSQLGGARRSDVIGLVSM